MSFREKVLWIAVTATLAIWIPYFVTLTSAVMAGDVDSGVIFWRMVGAVVLSIVVSVALVSLAAIANPKEATLQPDERERLLEYRANTVGYYVLALCVVIVAGGSFWGWSALVTANAMLASLLIADMIRGGVEIALLRRG